MKSPALVVPRERGEEIRKRLVQEGCLRSDLEILRMGTEIAFPLARESSEVVDLGRSVDLEFELRNPRTPRSYQDLLDWGQPEKSSLPRSFDVIGDIVLVRLPPELESRASEIGGALIRFVPGARTAGADLGVHGPERRRTIQRIAGTGSWKTRHRENGIEFEVDIEAAYFSPRLAREHARVASRVRSGERVLDLCAGIGPFSLLIAKQGRAREVLAIDRNPSAIGLLEATKVRTDLKTPLRTMCAKIEDAIPAISSFERVVFNLPREGIKYLPSVVTTVAPGGVLHYYEVTPRSDRLRRSEELVATLGGPGRWEITDTHLVHPYSPSADLRSFDFLSRGE